MGEDPLKAFLDYASIFSGIFWENEHLYLFSFFLEKELLAFSVIFHDCDPDFSTQKGTCSRRKGVFNPESLIQ